MAKTPTTTFRLDADTDGRLTQIAAHLSRITGVPVNRTDVIRKLVREFPLPQRSHERPAIAETTEHAA